MRFKDYADGTFTVKMKKPKRIKELNPNTLRTKTYKRVRVMVTSVTPEKRTLKNIPKYTDGRELVDGEDGEKVESEKAQEEALVWKIKSGAIPSAENVKVIKKADKKKIPSAREKK